MGETTLGEFELTVLMAVMRLGDDATGSRVRDEIEAVTLRRVARGAVYVTLDRLETKRLVGSKRAPGEPGRGGRPKRMYRLQASGVAAVERSLLAFERMRAGLKLSMDRR